MHNMRGDSIQREEKQGREFLLCFITRVAPWISVWLHKCMCVYIIRPLQYGNDGTYVTVIQWKQTLLSKLTACAQQQFSLSLHSMKEEWFLSLSTSSLGLPHYAQPLSVFFHVSFSSCRFPASWSTWSVHTGITVRTAFCVCQLRESRTVCSLGFQNTSSGPQKSDLFLP